MESYLKWRWVLSALGIVLALVLIVRGNYVVGALIAAMAITRIMMFRQMRRRRAAWQARSQSLRG